MHGGQIDSVDMVIANRLPTASAPRNVMKIVKNISPHAKRDTLMFYLLCWTIKEQVMITSTMPTTIDSAAVIITARNRVPDVASPTRRMSLI